MSSSCGMSLILRYVSPAPCHVNCQPLLTLGGQSLDEGIVSDFVQFPLYPDISENESTRERACGTDVARLLCSSMSANCALNLQLLYQLCYCCFNGDMGQPCLVPL